LKMETKDTLDGDSENSLWATQVCKALHGTRRRVFDDKLRKELDAERSNTAVYVKRVGELEEEMHMMQAESVGVEMNLEQTIADLEVQCAANMRASGHESEELTEVETELAKEQAAVAQLHEHLEYLENRLQDEELRMTFRGGDHNLGFQLNRAENRASAFSAFSRMDSTDGFTAEELSAELASELASVEEEVRQARSHEEKEHEERRAAEAELRRTMQAMRRMRTMCYGL